MPGEKTEGAGEERGIFPSVQTHPGCCHGQPYPVCGESSKKEESSLFFFFFADHITAHLPLDLAFALGRIYSFLKARNTFCKGWKGAP